MFVICYICGREFGKHSISIHIPQCKKKWEAEQSKLPKSQRRPLPQEPEAFEQIVKGEVSQEKMKEYNDQAFDDFNKKALEECHNCGRTFLPKALEVHLRSCKTNNAKKASSSSSGRKKPSVNIPKASAKKEEEAPTRDDILKAVKKEKVFDSVKSRQQLKELIDKMVLGDN